ncbi:DUF3000 domain-containing protein [Propionimicrobium sp. PCR01-08-3]|uniref:DUF3000 domain-containing protein n=1 Tax=Propionimicrobium sp. PCR01-08-3 TaxID=3052086 RepID=UPI00255C59C0|nr:DUF3000 domain-containing protein [Propionimicrobium sp. PCR01-08-3]WIY81400.1 DUF3000 domain-containing protein [Propionimicrobium sp. PCR01-08-3]
MLSEIRTLVSGGSSFERVTSAIEAFNWRPEIQAEQIPAPQRIAPYAYALEAGVTVGTDDEAGNGRLIILHDPKGNQAWNGDYRCVSFARADVGLEMVTDPLLAEVGWTWLTEALEGQNASYHDASGTVTAVSSRSFGELANEADRAEIEIRASWTPELKEMPDIVPHLTAWQALLCMTAGIPPLADGVVQLTNRLERQ